MIKNRLRTGEQEAMDRRSEQTARGYERRKHPRLTVTTLGATMRVRATLSGEQFTARLVDVSLGGCCIALPAAQARTLQDNGACVCALPVGIAGYPLEYAAAVVARRGEEAEPEHSVHLCFNGVTLHTSNLLVRWIASLSSRVRALDAGGQGTERAMAAAPVGVHPHRTTVGWKPAACAGAHR